MGGRRGRFVLRSPVSHAEPRAEPALEDFQLDDFMPYQLSVAASRVSELFAVTYSAEFDMTIAEWRVMAHVGRHGDLSVNVVAAYTSLDKVTVSRAVTRLVRKRLVRRRVNPQDARLVMLALTAAGRRIHHAIVTRGLMLERLIADELGQRDHAELHRLLARVRDAVPVVTLRLRS
ncbi:MAG: MarR family transcriptional regulator [Candidatus Eremiobacteraeota bacterium]|nr:MarR family transcriptional regulator [Candidatus Eremiobacteraeota bacterium]